MSRVRVPSRCLVLATALLLGTGAASPPFAPRALILFVASWCAPCRGELARLDTIVASAAPLDVRVVPIDRSRATAAMLRDVPATRIWYSARAVDALAQANGSLPFSIMTDARGDPCATHARALDAQAVAAMRARCTDSP